MWLTNLDVGSVTPALPKCARPVLKNPRNAPAGGSSNGRTADSDSASLGSNPSPPATQPRYYGANAPSFPGDYAPGDLR